MEEQSWSHLRSTLESQLLTLKPRPRIELIESLSQLKDIDVSEAVGVLFSTYSHYQDSRSRSAVQHALLHLTTDDQHAFQAFASLVSEISHIKQATAIVNIMTVLEWVNALLTNEKSTDERSVESIIDSQSILLEKILSAPVPETKQRLVLSAFRNSKSALVSAIRNRSLAFMSTLFNVLLQKSHTNVTQHVVLLGCLAAAATDLLPVIPGARQAIEEKKSEIYNLYINSILASKTIPASNLLSSLNPFFSDYTTQQDFDEILVPALSKSMLRAPEIVLVSIVPSLIMSLSPLVDLAKGLDGSLLNSFLSSLGSSKPDLREACSNSLSMALDHCYSSPLKDSMIVKIITALKKITNVDQRICYGKVLSSLKPSESLACTVPQSLVPLANREVNEQALASLTRTIFKQFIYGFSIDNFTPDKAVLDSIEKGFGEKRSNIKRIWVLSFAEDVLASEKKNERLLAFIKSVLPFIKSSFDEIVANPATAVQNKVIALAFAYVCLCKVANGPVRAEALFSSSSLKSALFSIRILTKLSTEDEFSWAIRATTAVSSIAESNPDVKLNWGKAWLYYCQAKSVPFTCRRQALLALQGLYAGNPQIIGDIVISTMSELLSSKTLEEDIPRENLQLIISSLFVQDKQLIDEVVLQRQLSELIVLTSKGSSAEPKGNWISLVLRSGIDPGSLVSQYHNKMIDCILRATEGPSELYDAACNASSILSFIDPKLIVQQLLSILHSNLDIKSLIDGQVSQHDIKIWNTPEGVLASEEDEEDSKMAKAIVENKNSKDYETRKWEESVRKEIAQKKAASASANSKKKLTKEEIELLASQSNVRSKVNSIVYQFKRGLGIINSLSMGARGGLVDNGREIWFSPSLNLVREILSNEIAFQLVGQWAVDTYLELAQNLSSRLDYMRKFIGISMLRSIYPQSVDTLDATVLDEPLKDLVNRVLYRLKFLSDQIPFDSITLTYIVPLFLKATEGSGGKSVKRYGIGTKNEEEIDEQLLLALDIVSSHAEEFKDPSTPRTDLLSNMIKLMEGNPSKAKQAKECLTSIVQSISLNYGRNELSVLLSGIVSGESFVRTAVLEAIDAELALEPQSYSQIWIAKFDTEPVIRELANEIWQENNLEINSVNEEQYISDLLQYLASPFQSLRQSCASGLDAIVGTASSSKITFHDIFDQLIRLYIEQAKAPAPIYDKFGIVVKSSAEQQDNWYPRSGCALAFHALARWFDDDSVLQFFKFLIEDKDSAALGDQNAEVRQVMQQAGLQVIAQHGLKNVESLIPIFEAYLSKPDKETKDVVSQSVIILYGALARHLSSDDERLLKIIDRLILTLESPSEDVQIAVSECLSPSVKLILPNLKNYISSILDKLFNSDTFAQRRGAAYGLAGLVKGAGISSLADYDIIRSLTDAVEDKKNQKKRQGAQFAFECLSQSLGRFFEPYAIEILPIILACLGDPAPEVREATSYAARMIMKNTTGYGIKKLIPLALENLEQTAWRAKKGSVELLGTMAYLDPRQLSSSLSTIVPEIVGVLNDTHKEVRNAANQSLQRFGEVIRNPEIQKLVPVLVKAIGDPTKYTDDALDGLLKTQFVHYIDAPSLALIIHVLSRGLRDRSAATKRKACQIVGNMSILTDSRDLVPYLGELVSELEVAMVDPVPATRATASRAIGSLVEKLGEDQFPDLIPRLLNVLKDEHRTGDRLGSAQALSEVIYGLGIGKLDELLPTILKNCTSPKYWVREGFMPLMIFLPASFGSSLNPYLSQIIPPILSGLADTVEQIRDTALRAGRLLVRTYSTKAVDLLLPELENGLSDINYRIRLSSVELTGDLLYQVTGISSSGGDEQDASVAGQANKTLMDVLGVERRDRILAALFVCRSDTSGMVRTSAVEVWKSLVANTPKTVKEILPTLTQIVIKRLASPEEEHRTIGAQTLGELVRRIGGNALSELLPTLEEGLISSNTDAKQGICIALGELITSTPADAMEVHQKTMIRIVRNALVDSDPNVREAAAQAFDVLQDSIGNEAVDQILPELIATMQSTSTPTQAENAFSALKEMMSTKSDVVFPVLIPTLLTPPMNAFKAKALGSLAAVAGTALYRRLSSIIDALVDSLVNAYDEDISDSLDSILLSVVHDEGSHILMQQLLGLGKHEDSKCREVVLQHMSKFFSESALDYSAYTQDWVTFLITSLEDRDNEVVKAAWAALNSLVSKLSKEELEHLVKPARDALKMTGAPGQELPGFALPKGPNCVLPIFLQGLMYGTSGEREQSALGIADIVERTSPENLRPFVTHMTGPLIRTIGERFPSDVKAAILYTLNVLLSKIPTFLKPFLPQLQRTFAKSLSDPSNELLRNRAAKALGTLITLQTRIDPLVTELINGARSSIDEGVITAMHSALSEIVLKAGKNLSPASKMSIIEFINEQMTKRNEDKLWIILAKTLGGITSVVEKSEATKIIRNILTIENEKLVVLAMNAVVKQSTDQIVEGGMVTEVLEYFIENCKKEQSVMSENAVVGLGKILLTQSIVSELDNEEQESIFSLLGQLMVKSGSRSPDTRRLALVVLRTVGRINYALVRPYLDDLVLPVFGCVRDTIIPVKLAAEKAYLTILRLVEELNEEEDGLNTGSTFENWLERAKASLNPQQLRSVQDYTRRVGIRLAKAEKDRINAGGDAETVYSDRIEDELEIWNIGGVGDGNAA